MAERASLARYATIGPTCDTCATSGQTSHRQMFTLYYSGV